MVTATVTMTVMVSLAVMVLVLVVVMEWSIRMTVPKIYDGDVDGA